MKLLFDQNLSFRLVKLIEDLFPDSSHVSYHALGSAPDFEVWDFARTNEFVLVSKDSDMHEFGMLHGFPPYIVWIRRGNCSTDEIATILHGSAGMIRDLPGSVDSGILELF
jgi:predicted nuclease of predicted toxin-antitoxin system